MTGTITARAKVTLALNTLAFTVCFAAWMLNGVLVTFLVDHRVYTWSNSQMGWLIGIPVLSGSILRLPTGMLTDKYGGRVVFPLLLIASAVPMFLLSTANSFWSFFLCSLGFGLSGASFAVGIAATSVWFPREKQGIALGIFGAGNAGSAVTTLSAPTILRVLTDRGRNLEQWRMLPRIYAIVLVGMAVVLFLGTTTKLPQGAGEKDLKTLLAPLRRIRVWRFGLYYFLVFGCFVALAQWLVPYYVNVYSLSVASAGFMTSIFSLPSGMIRALGGWLSDRYGARRVMYWVLGSCAIGCLLLVVPKMDIESPGRGVMATRPGVVTAITDREIRVGNQRYPVVSRPDDETRSFERHETLLFPVTRTWQTTTVHVGDRVARRQLLARGVTHIYFQANIWIFTALVFIVGIMMGIGKAAVYKHIPEYYPEEVGVVGGIVGVIGGLGGFVCPILFGNLLDRTGLWTTTWMLLLFVAIVCLVWMNAVVKRMERHI